MALMTRGPRETDDEWERRVAWFNAELDRISRAGLLILPPPSKLFAFVDRTRPRVPVTFTWETP